MIDGTLADGPSMTWNTYAMSGDTATITLTWDQEYDLYGMRVMWWSDNGGVKFPQSCKAEYYDAEADSWVELTDMTDETGAAITSVGVKFGTETTAASSERNYTNGNNRYWNVATFTEPIKTSRLRLTPTRNGSGSTGFGIGEWEVFGEVSGSVDEAELESITVTPPTKTEYTVGEDLDLAGMKVTANYSDDTTEDVAIEDCEVSGYDKTKAGEQTVTVTYEGKTATFKVTVKEAEKPVTLESITVTAPTKTEYTVGDELDLAGMKVVAKYSDDTEKEITEGYEVSGYDKAKTGEQTVTVTYEGKTATFKVTVKEEAVAPKLPYVDVAESDWFYDAAYYNYFAETMTGTDPTHFSPYEILPRAQFAVILYRMNGKPQVEYTPKFPDVADGLYYSDAIIWAKGTGVVGGYANGNFGPDDYMTREQLATMMYRYAKYKGYDTEKGTDLTAFPDAGNVTEFAETAMSWAVAKGLITGDNGNLNPQGTANRAVTATIMNRFVEAFGE